MFKHYTVTDNIFNKIIFYNKKVNSTNVELEAELQELSSKYGFSPKIIDTVYEDDKAIINMEFINEPCLFYKYGKYPEDIPEFVWDQMRIKLLKLYQEEGVQYFDITPYNFIEKDGNVYVIDFGHANYIYEDEEPDEFFIDFLQGENDWNYDFYDIPDN